MPLTPEQAISGAMRGAMRAIDEGNIDPGQYGEFLSHAAIFAHQAWEAVGRAAKAHSEDADEETLQRLGREGYHRAIHLAVTSLLALAHCPFLDRVDHPLPSDEKKLH